jgi:hypothetical protein
MKAEFLGKPEFCLSVFIDGKGGVPAFLYTQVLRESFDDGGWCVKRGSIG